MYLAFIPALLLVGCSSGATIIALTKQDKIENQYLAFNAPTQGWYLIGSREWGMKNYGTHPEHSQGKRIYSDVLAGHQIHIYVSPITKKRAVLSGIDFRDQVEKLRTHPDPKSVYEDRMGGIYFKEYRLVYIDGLQCRESFEIEGAKGLSSPYDKHWYQIVCDYYQKDRRFEDGKRMLNFHYFYTANHGTSKNLADTFLFQSIKEVMDSMNIKNVDVDRMVQLGLLHKDKKFEVPNYKIYVQEQREQGYLTPSEKAEMLRIMPLMKKHPFEYLPDAWMSSARVISKYFEKRDVYKDYTTKDYKKDAYDVILTGSFVPEQSSYIKLMGKESDGMYAVVELNKETEKITAFYISSKALLFQDKE